MLLKDSISQSQKNFIQENSPELLDATVERNSGIETRYNMRTKQGNMLYNVAGGPGLQVKDNIAIIKWGKGSTYISIGSSHGNYDQRQEIPTIYV